MAAAVGSEGGRSDGAEEDEVEEQLVMVELSGIIDSDFLEKCENKCKILGIETERPILQVDRYVFAGEYEDALGTCVVFEENTEQDAEGNQKVQLKYKCHTVKKLNMTRTLLTEKKEGEENVGGVEWLQIKDRDFSYSRLNMICSFLPEKDDSEESAQAQDKLTEESEGEEEVADCSEVFPQSPVLQAEQPRHAPYSPHRFPAAPRDDGAEPRPAHAPCPAPPCPAGGCDERGGTRTASGT